MLRCLSSAWYSQILIVHALSRAILTKKAQPASAVAPNVGLGSGSAGSRTKIDRSSKLVKWLGPRWPVAQNFRAERGPEAQSLPVPPALVINTSKKACSFFFTEVVLLGCPHRFWAGFRGMTFSRLADFEATAAKRIRRSQPFCIDCSWLPKQHFYYFCIFVQLRRLLCMCGLFSAQVVWSCCRPHIH